MGIVTNSIGTAAGRDYSSPQAWANALPASLVTAGNSYVGQCYNDPSGEFTVAGTVLTLTGHTTDASHTITLTTATGQSFRDVASPSFQWENHSASIFPGTQTTVTMGTGGDGAIGSDGSISEGDVLLIWLVVMGSTADPGVITGPAGFTTIVSDGKGSGYGTATNFCRWYVGYKVCDGTEGASFTASWPTASTGLNWGISNWRGAASNPFRSIYAGPYAPAIGGPITAPPVNANNGDVLVCLWGSLSGQDTGAPPGGFTTRFDTASTSTTRPEMRLASKSITTTGSTGSQTVTDPSGHELSRGLSLVLVPSIPLRYDVTKGVGLHCTVSYADGISCADGNVFISNLQVLCSSGKSDGIVFTGPTSTVDDCIIEANDVGAFGGVVIGGGIQSGGNSTIIRNCLLIQNGASANAIARFAGLDQVYNCTLVVPSDVAAASFGIGGNYGSPTAKNVAVFNATSIFSTAAIWTSTTCMTDVAVPPTGWTGGKTYANQFRNTLSTIKDFRDKVSADLLGSGTEDQTNSASDIFGFTRQPGTKPDIGCHQLVPTTVSHAVGTAITRDYSTIQAWYNAGPTNMISNAEVWEGQCFNDSEFLGTSSTPILVANGATTDTTHHMSLTTGAGQSFRDNASAQTNALAYNQTNGVGIRTNQKYIITLQVNDHNFHFSNLQVKADTTDHAMALGWNAGAEATADPVIADCIMMAPGQGSAFSAVLDIESSTLNGYCSVSNSLIVKTASTGSGGIIVVSNDTTNLVSLYNCTLACSDAGSPQAGIVIGDSSGHLAVENTAIFANGAPAALYGAGTDPSAAITWTTCMTDATTFLSTGLTGGKVYANQFVSVTSDWKLKAGANLIDAGTTDTTHASTDIVGTSRPQGSAYDIGAWELVAAGIVVTFDMPLPTEFLYTPRRDAPYPLESLGTVRRDAPYPLEVLAQVKKDGPVPLEFLITSSGNAALPLEALSSVRRDGTAPVEFLFNARSDSVVPLESLGAIIITVTTNALLPLEWVTTSALSIPLPAESIARSFVDQPITLEVTGTVKGDEAMPVSWTASLVRDNRIPAEWTITVRRDGAIPTEVHGRFTSFDSILAIEWGISSSTDERLPAEIVSALAAALQVYLLGDALMVAMVKNEQVKPPTVANEAANIAVISNERISVPIKVIKP